MRQIGGKHHRPLLQQKQESDLDRLKTPRNKCGSFRFFDLGPGGYGDSGKPSVGLPVASGGLPEAPGPTTNQSNKPRNLKDLIDRWSDF